jgi:adenylate cyclase class 2
MGARLEIEMKFAVGDLPALRRAIARIGAKPGRTLQEKDFYFNHPSRDFAQTDEALRIRKTGRRIEITYKGPKIDRDTKTRREIELGLASVAAGDESAIALLAALGFRQIATVQKKRREYTLRRSKRSFKILIDDVQGLGTFVEIETLAAECDVHSARDGVIQLSSDLGLTGSERRSYLELLLSVAQ